MERIINLTQHNASAEQREVGVYEPAEKERVKNLLTFEEIPDKETMSARATALAEIVIEEKTSIAMIGGAPYFMSTLESVLRKEGIHPVYAFSKRESVEKTLPDGSVEKIAVFKHCGFVEVE